MIHSHENQLDARDSGGRTVLHLACSEGDFDYVLCDENGGLTLTTMMISFLYETASRALTPVSPSVYCH